MFDLDAFDAELERRFRKPERRRFFPRSLTRNETISAVAVTAALCTSTVVAASVAFMEPSPRVAMTSDMTYNGLTIEQFAQDVGISIYDPYVLVLFEDLCMQDPEPAMDA